MFENMKVIFLLPGLDISHCVSLCFKHCKQKQTKTFFGFFFLLLLLVLFLILAGNLCCSVQNHLHVKKLESPEKSNSLNQFNSES